MTRERRKQEIQRVHDKLAILQEKAKRLEEEDKQADDAEKMKIIEKNKITVEELILLSKLGEQERAELIKRKQQEEEIQENIKKEQETHEKTELIP